MKYEMRCKFHAELPLQMGQSEEEVAAKAESMIQGLHLDECRAFGGHYSISGSYTAEVEASNATEAHRMAESAWLNTGFQRCGMSYPSRSIFIPTEPIKSKVYDEQKICIEDFDMKEDIPMVTFLLPEGFRTAYIGIPKTHPLYNDECLLPTARGALTGDDITFTDRSSLLDELAYEQTGKQCSDTLWLGFDTGHYNEHRDIEAVEKMFGATIANYVKMFSVPMPEEQMRPLRGTMDCMHELYAMQNAVQERTMEQARLLSCYHSIHIHNRVDTKVTDKEIVIPLKFYDADGYRAMEMLWNRVFRENYGPLDDIAGKPNKAFLINAVVNRRDLQITGEYIKNGQLLDKEEIPLSSAEASTLRDKLEQEFGKSFSKMLEPEKPYFDAGSDYEAFHKMVKDIFQSIKESDPNELKRLYSWEYCELDPEFPAFLDVYADLKDKVPKEFTVIDLGCCQALQGDYFKEHVAYIGVDNGVPNEWRLRQSNAQYHECSIQQFIQEVLPGLGLDLNKTFAVCSYVPDEEARKMVRDTFPFHREYYVGCALSERLPDKERTQERTHHEYER